MSGTFRQTSDARKEQMIMIKNMMFKPGDRVRRVGITYSWEGMYFGREYVVADIEPNGDLLVEGLHRWYNARHFELVE